MPALVRALKRVDLPTLGRPTMPHLRLMTKFFLNQKRYCSKSGRLTIAFAAAGAAGRHEVWILPKTWQECRNAPGLVRSSVSNLFQQVKRSARRWIVFTLAMGWSKAIVLFALQCRLWRILG